MYELQVYRSRPPSAHAGPIAFLTIFFGWKVGDSQTYIYIVLKKDIRTSLYRHKRYNFSTILNVQGLKNLDKNLLPNIIAWCLMQRLASRKNWCLIINKSQKWYNSEQERIKESLEISWDLNLLLSYDGASGNKITVQCILLDFISPGLKLNNLCYISCIYNINYLPEKASAVNFQQTLPLSYNSMMIQTWIRFNSIILSVRMEFYL